MRRVFLQYRYLVAYIIAFRHHAISMKLNRPFVFDGKPFIMQYEVNFQDGIECGGAYVKLLSETKDLNLVNIHAFVVAYSGGVIWRSCYHY